MLPKYLLIINERKKWNQKTSATGRRTSEKETVEELLSMVGIKKGSKKATAKFVNKMEITVNSILPFNKFIITGEAMAVGAIAVIKAICASCKLPEKLNPK
ncbi:MAG: hypothetical protein H6613_07320 [Ignavibacteriales bacterium]|nr:hypothetical protein [Ignavibacteriales bacterium]